MKTTLFAILFLIVLKESCVAQDVITDKAGNRILSKVLEVTPKEVKYLKYDTPDGPIYILSSDEILSIKFESALNTLPISKDSLAGNSTVIPEKLSEELFNKGQDDAYIYYKNYKIASTAILVTTVLPEPLTGLLTAIICSSTKPNEGNLNCPNTELKNNKYYYAGYVHRAKKIKQGKIWKNFGIGLGIDVAFAILILQALSH